MKAAAFELFIAADIDHRDRKGCVTLRLAGPGLRSAANVEHSNLWRRNEEVEEMPHATTPKMYEYVIAEAIERQLHRTSRKPGLR